MSKQKLYGVPAKDRADAKQQLEEWRAQRNDGRTFDVRPDNGMIVVMVLFRPIGFDAGLCARLVRDPVRPFVWLITLVGYPAISGRQYYKLRWTHKDGTIIESEKISAYATPGEFHALLPDEVKPLVTVSGGTMKINHNGLERECQTGRWFVAFADLPEWTPTFFEMSDPRLQGLAEVHDMKPNGKYDYFRTLASISGPMPIHPGSMAIGWMNSGVLRLGPVEARIYQEYFAGIATAQYAWRLMPFTLSQFEGEPIEIEISLAASFQDRRDGDVELSVAVQLDLASNITLDDFEGTLDDWMLTAISGRDEFTWAAGRLTLTLNPEEDLKSLNLVIPTINDGVVEGQQLFAIRLTNAKASSGVIFIEQSECSVILLDKDSARFSISGPLIAAAPGDAEYKLLFEGLFQEDTAVSVTISPIGDATEADTTDWIESLAAVVATLPGVTLDRVSGRLLVITESQGGIAPIAFTVGFLDTAGGKSFGLALSDPDVVGGDAVIGDGEILTELRSAAVFSITGNPTTHVPGNGDFTLSVGGVFRAGDVMSVRLSPVGNSLSTDRADWMTAVEIGISTIGGASFDRGSQRLTIRTLSGGEISDMQISVEFFGSAAGKTFGIGLSSPELIGGSAAIGSADFLTQLQV